MAQRQPKKSRKRKWVRYEREHSNSMWHTYWKQIHTGMHKDRWFLCYEDDASRFVTGYGIFDNVTAENALYVLEQAIKDHGKPASIMTDHGSQFYANEKETGSTWNTPDTNRRESSADQRKIGETSWGDPAQAS